MYTLPHLMFSIDHLCFASRLHETDLPKAKMRYETLLICIKSKQIMSSNTLVQPTVFVRVILVLHQSPTALYSRRRMLVLRHDSR